MDVKKIRELSGEDLAKHETQAGEQVFRIRFQKSMGNLEGLKRLKGHKRDIARIKTVRREQVLEAERKASPVVKSAAPLPSQRTARKKAKKG